MKTRAIRTFVRVLQLTPSKAPEVSEHGLDGRTKPMQTHREWRHKLDMLYEHTTAVVDSWKSNLLSSTCVPCQEGIWTVAAIVIDVPDTVCQRKWAEVVADQVEVTLRHQK